jgi:hypothetical protein
VQVVIRDSKELKSHSLVPENDLKTENGFKPGTWSGHVVLNERASAGDRSS